MAANRETQLGPPCHLLGDLCFTGILCMAQFFSLTAMMLTVAPMLILAEFFDISDSGRLSWLSAAYSLTVGTFILPAGRLGDIYGHKKILLIGWAWFSMLSLASGFCKPSDLLLLSALRAFQGVGPALLLPNAIALIGRNFPVGLKRNLAFACFAASGPTGATFGAVFGARVSETMGWNWCFWILSAQCAFFGLVSCFFLPGGDLLRQRALQPQRGTPATTTHLGWPSFDWQGALTGVTGLLLLNIALNEAPMVGWREPYILVLLALGPVCLGAFVYVELFSAAEPLVPIHNLQRSAILTLSCVFFGWSSHGIWLYYLYVLLEDLRGHSASLASLEMCPVAVTGVIFAFLTVWLLYRFHVSWVMFAAMGFFVFGNLLLAVAPLDQAYWANTFVSVLLMPGAMDLSFPAATILLSSALPKEKQGIAASLVATTLNYGISCGLGLAGSVHNYALNEAVINAGLKMHSEPAISSSQLKAVRLVGLRAAYWFAVALAVLGIVVAGMFALLSGRRHMEGSVELNEDVLVRSIQKKVSIQRLRPFSLPEILTPPVAMKFTPSNRRYNDYNHHSARPWV